MLNQRFAVFQFFLICIFEWIRSPFSCLRFLQQVPLLKNGNINVIYTVFSSIVVHFGGFLGGGGGFNLAPPNAGFAAHSLSGSAAGGFGGGSAGSGTGGSVQPLQKVERVRNVFPETWLWTNKTTGYLLCCIFALQVDAVVLCF